MFRSSIFKSFQTWNPGIVKEMKNCSHHYEEENGRIHLNKWHLEGDVWSHTCMVYNHIIPTFEGLVAALCHDIGKIFTARKNHEKKRVSFGGHGNASVQYTADFLNYLMEYGNDIEKKQAKDNFSKIITVVSNHIEYYALTSIPEIAKLCNYNEETLKLFYDLADADNKGVIYDDKEGNRKDTVNDLYYHVLSFINKR